MSGCVLNACPAIGYVDSSPIAVVFERALPADATVSACLGAGCVPAAVAASGDASYEVPQRAPYLDSDPIQPTTVRVVVATDEAVLHDAVHDIPIHSERTGLWGQCPGPWSYEPVVVRLE